MHLAAANSLVLNANDKRGKNFERNVEGKGENFACSTYFPGVRTFVSEVEKASSSPEEHQTWTDDHFEKPTNFT